MRTLPRWSQKKMLLAALALRVLCAAEHLMTGVMLGLSPYVWKEAAWPF